MLKRLPSSCVQDGDGFKGRTLQADTHKRTQAVLPPSMAEPIEETVPTLRDPTWLRLGPDEPSRDELRHSRAESNRTWVMSPQRNLPPPPSLAPPPPPPPLPIPIPSPAQVAQGQSERGRFQEEDEYMQINADDPELDQNAFNNISYTCESPSGRRRGFTLGGLVNGLRRLPRAVVRGPRARRRDTEGTDTTMPPMYQAQPDGDHIDPANVIYVQATEMPDPTHYNGETYHISDTDPTSPPQNSRRVSTEVRRQSGAVEAQAQEANPDGRSPLAVDPLPTADYAKMATMTFSRTSGTGTNYSNLPSLLSGLHKLYEMPWISHHRFTSDYYPGQNLPENGRAKVEKPPTSWYNVLGTRRRSIDLLSTGSTSTRPSGIASTGPRRSGQSSNRTHAGHGSRHRPSRHNTVTRDGHRNRMTHHNSSSRRRSNVTSVRPPGGGPNSSSTFMYSPMFQPQPFYLVPSPPPPAHIPTPQRPDDSNANMSSFAPTTPTMFMVVPSVYTGEAGATRGPYPMSSTPIQSPPAQVQ